uniref:Chitin-binding type-2 domain-containing protein n=1 Tax=Panagrellus redivivus TaxID=6233 RepID=A0A7E4UP76_PANRE
MGFGKCKQLGGKIIAGICIVEPIKKQETTTEPPTSDEVPTTTKGFVHKVYCPEGTVLSKADEQCHGKMSFAKCRQLGGKRINRICVVEPRTKTSGATKEPGTSDEAPPTTKGFIHEVFCPEGTVLSKVDNKCHGRMGFSKCKQLGGKIIAGVCIIEPIEKQETTTEPPTSDEVPSTTESFEQQLFCPEGTVLSKVDGKCHGKISFAKCRQLSGKRINRICVVEPRTKIGSATKKPGTSDEVHPTAESFAQKVFCPEGTVLSKVDGKCHGKMNFSKCRQLGGKRIAGVCIVAAKKPTTPFAPTAEPSELSTEPKDPQTTTEEFDNFTYCPKGTVLSKKTGKCYGKMGPSKCNLLGGKIIAGFCIVLPKLVNPITTEEPKPTTEEPEATTEYILPPTTREPRKPLVIFPAAFNSNATFYTKEPKIIICRSDAPANTRTERCEKSTTAAQCAKLKGVYYDKLGLCSIPPHVQRVPLCYGDLDYYSGIHFCGLDYSEDECNNRGYAFYKNRCIYAPIKKLLSCPAGSSLSKVQGEQQLNKCIHKLARKKCEKNGFKYENRQCFSYAEPCPAGYSYHNGYESCKKPNANKASCKHDKGVLYSGACFVPPLVE